MKYSQRGFILILTAPSGGGKGVLARHLQEKFGDVRFSVSTTTRAARPGEEEGVHYFFVDQAQFQSMIDRGDFVEWAEVFGNYYGTARKFLEEAMTEGATVILDIDWQGAGQIRRSMPKGDVVSVAIVPPSRDILHQRLVTRGQDSSEVIERRMTKAATEISHWVESDYVIVNDDLNTAQREMRAIFRAERCRRERMASSMPEILATFGL